MNTRIFTDEKSFITLKDGRKLGFRVYGPSKKEEADQIVLYFVGTPGTRNYLTTKQEQQLTKYNQICFITVERPGFGISDHKHGRTIMDYVQDVEEFAKQLEIIKCSIIAYSGGGPFALACAYKLPHLITSTFQFYDDFYLLPRRCSKCLFFGSAISTKLDKKYVLAEQTWILDSTLFIMVSKTGHFE
jgi:pimeloyl-ACP methyl ester carboxylesterase